MTIVTTSVNPNRDSQRARAVRTPDRLGDAVRELAHQADEHGADRVQFGVRIGHQVAVFELHHLRTTKVWHSRRSGKAFRVGSVLCIDPK